MYILLRYNDATYKIILFTNDFRLLFYALHNLVQYMLHEMFDIPNNILTIHPENCVERYINIKNCLLDHLNVFDLFVRNTITIITNVTLGINPKFIQIYCCFLSSYSYWKIQNLIRLFKKYLQLTHFTCRPKTIPFKEWHRTFKLHFLLWSHILHWPNTYMCIPRKIG